MTAAGTPRADREGRRAAVSLSTPASELSRAQIGRMMLATVGLIVLPIAAMMACALQQSAWAAAMQRSHGGFWRAEPPDWVLLPTFAFVPVVVVLALLVKLQPLRRRAILGLMLVLVAADVVGTRGYVAVSGGTVVRRSNLFWRPQTRFSLADAQVLARGCEHSHGYKSDGDEGVFLLRAKGGGPTVNLAQTLSGEPRTAASLVTALQALPPEALTAASAAEARHDPTCLDAVSVKLDADGRRALARLLGSAS